MDTNINPHQLVSQFLSFARPFSLRSEACSPAAVAERSLALATPVAEVTVSPIGTGQTGATYRAEVTYGAGGSTRERTHKTVARILRETKLVPAAHLTCVDASRDEVDDVAARHPDLLRRFRDDARARCEKRPDAFGMQHRFMRNAGAELPQQAARVGSRDSV